LWLKLLYTYAEHERLGDFMAKRPVGVLSLGILILAVAVSTTASVVNVIGGIFEIFAITLILLGLWIVILAALRAANPEGYGEGAFNTFSGGILLTMIGGLWFLLMRNLFVGYLLPILLLAVGVLVVIAGIRAWRK
jgi:uncharacterized Tic20 family protein